MLKRVTIDELVPDEANQLIVAVIIFAQDPRMLTSRSGEPRTVWNLTLRGSPSSTINVAIWGSPGDIHNYTDSFRIGDVVEIQSPRVQIRQDDNYTPEVSCAFQLTLNAGQQNSAMVLHEAPPMELEKFQALLSIPTKPPQSFVTLGDVRNASTPMTGTLLNFLVAVRSVGVTRSIKTRGGRESVVRTVSVFDQSGATNALSLQIWNFFIAERAAFWTPRETVLFIADARLEWSAFRRGLEVRLTSKSVITEDPDTEEAAWLRDYARTAPINAVSALDQITSTMIDPSTVQKVLTAATIKSRCSAVQVSSGNDAAESPHGLPLAQEHFTAVLFAAVTRFDIDGPSERLLKSTCTTCRSPIENSDGICFSLGCANRADRPAKLAFDLRVDLSDHTGTLHNCRLTGDVAEAVVGCTVAEFLELPSEATTELKWRLLLERCVARLVVLPASDGQRAPLVSLLSLDLADPAEVAQRMPMH